MIKNICVAIMGICTTIVGCPMGLGKKYKDKPPFFHPTFYHYKTIEQKKQLPFSCKIDRKTSDSRKLS